MNETWSLLGRNLQILKGRHVAERLTELVTFALSLQSLERPDVLPGDLPDEAGAAAAAAKAYSYTNFMHRASSKHIFIGETTEKKHLK